MKKEKKKQSCSLLLHKSVTGVEKWIYLKNLKESCMQANFENLLDENITFLTFSKNDVFFINYWNLDKLFLSDDTITKIGWAEWQTLKKQKKINWLFCCTTKIMKHGGNVLPHAIYSSYILPLGNTLCLVSSYNSRHCLVLYPQFFLFFFVGGESGNCHIIHTPFQLNIHG